MKKTINLLWIFLLLFTLLALGGKTLASNNEYSVHIPSPPGSATVMMDGDKTIKANFKKALFPPVSVRGEKVTNRSLLLVQYINTLSWEAHPQNIEIAKYRIYLTQDGVMQHLGEVGAGTLFYWHFGVEKDTEYIYGICSVNQNGQESEPAFISIK